MSSLFSQGRKACLEGEPVLHPEAQSVRKAPRETQEPGQQDLGEGSVVPELVVGTRTGSWDEER